MLDHNNIRISPVFLSNEAILYFLLPTYHNVDTKGGMMISECNLKKRDKRTNRKVVHIYRHMGDNRITNSVVMGNFLLNVCDPMHNSNIISVLEASNLKGWS
jgi:hypothetical protein